MQSGSSPGDPNSQSPLDQQGPPTQREQTPEGPEQQRAEKPSQDKPGGGDPRSPEESNERDPKNRQAGDPPLLELESAGHAIDDADRWGDLPVHVREVFRAEGSGDMPARYRDWIDSYYRRLNETR